MSRKNVLLVAAALVVLGTVGTVLALATRSGKTETKRSDGSPPVKVTSTKKTYAELVAANYKILKPEQKKRLLDFADAAYACMSRRFALGRPKPSPTKIVMALPKGVKGFTVGQYEVMKCARTIGDPPAGSSFVVRGHNMILYLPKYCILDKKTVVSTKALPKP
jgi:hypothetical protein